MFEQGQTVRILAGPMKGSLAVVMQTANTATRVCIDFVKDDGDSLSERVFFWIPNRELVRA